MIPRSPTSTSISSPTVADHGDEVSVDAVGRQYYREPPVPDQQAIGVGQDPVFDLLTALLPVAEIASGGGRSAARSPTPRSGRQRRPGQATDTFRGRAAAAFRSSPANSSAIRRHVHLVGVTQAAASVHAQVGLGPPGPGRRLGGAPRQREPIPRQPRVRDRPGRPRGAGRPSRCAIAVTATTSPYSSAPIIVKLCRPGRS